MFSGISVEIRETGEGYRLSKVIKDGKQVSDNDLVTVTCLAIPKHIEAYPAEEGIVFEEEKTTVKTAWIDYVSDGNATLAEPEDYINVR
mgnify:FL=1